MFLHDAFKYNECQSITCEDVMIKIGGGKMMRKNIWIMFLSIAAVTLMITTPVSATIQSNVKTDTTKEQQTSIVSTVNVDSGRISLEEKAEVKTSTSSSQITDTLKADDSTDASSGTAKPDTKSDIKPTDQVTGGTGSITGASNSDETEVVPNENESSDPSDDLIWLAVQGDEVDGSSGFDANNNSSGGNIALPPQTDVDEVFVASSSGIVDKTVSVDSNLQLSLNILGYARVDVISGSENLISGPYFNGLDVFDRLSLAAASAAIMFLVRAIQILDIAFPLADAIIIATTVSTLVFDAIIYAINHGLNILDQLINIGLTIEINGHTYVLGGVIRDAVKSLIFTILNVMDNFLGKILEILVPYADQSIDNVVDFIEGLRDLFVNTDFKALINQLYSNSQLAVYAILQVLQRKDTSQIETYLEQIGLSHSTAQTLVSLLNSYDNLFVGIRDNIFGKFDAFMTYGRDSTPLRNIHANIDPNCQIQQGEYAAIIEIKAISAGQVFDTKTIGILYAGSGENIPESSGDLLVSGSETLGSTTMGSTVSSSAISLN